MTVAETGVIDFVGMENDGRACVLTISDHLSWEDPEHMNLLQANLNAYLAFIESGELYENYPNATDRDIEINVVMRFAPSRDAIYFFTEAAKLISNAGFRLSWKQFNE